MNPQPVWIPNQIIEIRKLISSLGKEKTLMLSTHIMQEVEAICQRAIIIDKGKIVKDHQTGSASSENGKDSRFIIIEFDKKPEEGSIALLDGIVSVIPLSPHTFNIETEAGNDLRPMLFNFAVENGLAILSMQMKEKNMEEIFRDATGKK